ncbi:Uncharacterized protein TCM_038564 [Theobroma cacao]|uniref:Retrotransposon Copia-like N-terminal domain-containing protein n=1 Tax=Theobroma cacao TaxID=3641 RepID=A0A061GWV8_THECC|nr:Uncharacterized protein TCM_038564 [Theobroma cacao]
MSSLSSKNTTCLPTTSSNPTLLFANLQNPLININAATYLPIKLTLLNFPSWRTQLKSFLVGYKLLGYVNGSTPCLLTTIPQKESVVPFFTSAETSFDARAKINKLYANKYRSQMMNLREKLKKSKGTKIVAKYFQNLISIANELALVNSLVSGDELVIHALNGIGFDFRKLQVV